LPAGGDEVRRGGCATARPGIDVIDLGGLGSAIRTGPAIALENRAAKDRMDTSLGRIGSSGVPVQERVGS
jgi:hypothetical protein